MHQKSRTPVSDNLKIGMWNIEGLTTDKISDTQSMNVVSQLDIVSLVETWSNGDHLNIPGHVLVSSTYRKKHKNARRHSGGISVYVKPNIHKGVYTLKNEHTDIQWVRLDKHFFKLQKDIYLATVYISPQKSPGDVPDLESIYAALLDNIQNFCRLGDIFIHGDFNAYTNTNSDYIESDDTQYPQMEDNCSTDLISPRNNMDAKRLNKSGRYLLDLCKESSLKLLNGRCMGDIFGNFTCYTYNGCSLADYAAASAHMHCKIARFQAQNFTSLSNHCPISCSLLSSFADDHGAHDKLSPLPGKFLWNSSSIEAYTVKFQSQETQQKLQSFIAENFENSDTAANTLSSLLCETASASTILIKGNSPYHKRKTRHKPWFSQSCKELHSTVKKYAKLVHMFPFNGSYRKEFYTYKSKFRRLCSTQKKMFKKNICDELLSKIKSDPKSFWQLINKLDKFNSSDNTEELNITEFTNFYKKTRYNHLKI